MFFKKYDSLKKKQLSILDETGKIVDTKNDPKLDKETLMGMYKTFVLTRIADQRALNYQRQGRMLTFPPTRGQEAIQIGLAQAMEKQDWLSPYFRDLASMLHRGVRLDQIFLYWYGNEWGNHFDPTLNTLPVNVVIGSQIPIGAGLAYASQLLNKNQVVLATIGDGGTSHGEFYEGLNFASVYNSPLVVLIQNNQYAISTPRSKATKAETLAQKAVAFGIPGIQVDGNDILAVYKAVKEAVDYARAGNGPVLIEAISYRLTAHTTSDDPTIYRSDEEVAIWEAKEPLIRFKKYLTDLGYLTDEVQAQIEKEAEAEVIAAFDRIENELGAMPLEDIFKYMYADWTPQLREQYEAHKKFLEEAGK